eukprot:8960922-Heterocapsa_arctica.AAC.1
MDALRRRRTARTSTRRSPPRMLSFCTNRVLSPAPVTVLAPARLRLEKVVERLRALPMSGVVVMCLKMAATIRT